MFDAAAMPDDCTDASGNDETTTSTTDVMTTTMTMTMTSPADDVEMQSLDNSLLQSDAGDEDRLQIVVEEPTADEDQQHDEPQDAGQCPSAGDLVDDHADSAAAACPGTPANELVEMPADVPPVSQVT